MKTQLPAISFILIAASSCCIQFAQAQIIYTDVNPDSTILCTPDSSCSSTYNLDLNNDGADDFTITLYSYTQKINCAGCHHHIFKTSDTIIIRPLSDNGVVFNSCKLDQNSLIDSNSLSWSGNSNKMARLNWTFDWCQQNVCFAAPHASGDWSADSVDKYLGLRIHSGTEIYYGWARLDVINSSSFTIKDYAYNSIPDSSILSGDTGGLPLEISAPISGDNFSVSPNPSCNKITLSFSSSEKKEIQITNTIGQIVFAEEINSVKEEIDLSEFPAGMYVVSAQTSTQKIEKKFLKQ